MKYGGGVVVAGPWNVTQLMKDQHRYPKVQQFKRNMGVPLPWPAHKIQKKQGNINIFIIKCNKSNEIVGGVVVAGP